MRLSIGEYNSKHEIEIKGVSYIGNPESNTVMYVGRKLSYLLSNLERVEQCLVFVETGSEIDERFFDNHTIVITDNPQLEYANFSQRLYREVRRKELINKVIPCKGGYYKSEDAIVEKNAYIEPGVYIGHGTVIGEDAVVLAGSSIRYSTIGNGVKINEQTVVGTDAYTMATNENGNKVRIFSLGSVVVGEDVEIGSQCSVSRGSVGKTFIENNVKLDSFVHIGHDVHVGKNVEIAAGTVVGGFADIGEESFLGLNSTIKNRVSIGCNDFVGMGAAVMSSAPDNITLAGNPAKGLLS